MNSNSVFNELFEDNLIISRIKNKLSSLFLLAELESSRNGKIGMEIGSVQERILIALLMYKFGIDIVNPDIAITQPEIDVFVKGQPLSIKTITTPTQNINKGVKLIWTVDAKKAVEFKNTFRPSCDLLMTQIVWNNEGKLCLFSKKSQNDVLDILGRDNYFLLPKAGTNSREVEISKEALKTLLTCEDTKILKISFLRKKIDFRQIYTKWLDAWIDEY